MLKLLLDVFFVNDDRGENAAWSELGGRGGNLNCFGLGKRSTPTLLDDTDGSDAVTLAPSLLLSWNLVVLLFRWIMLAVMSG